MVTEEKTLHSQQIFTGQVVNLRVDTVALPDGREATREIIEHQGAVAVIPVDEQGMVYLVRQYRKPVEAVLLEIPAGKLEPGEDVLDCARRELSEETGLSAKSFGQVCSYYTTPGFTNEIIHVFVATGLTMEKSHPDADEFLELVRVPLEEAYRLVMAGQIKDGKSIIAIQHLMLKEIGAGV